MLWYLWLRTPLISRAPTFLGSFIYIDRVEKGEIEDARQIHILTLYSQSKNSLVQWFFCSVIAVRIICGIISVRIICNIIAVRRNYELLVFQVVRLSITVQIRILSTGSWSPSSYPHSPLQDDSKRDRNQKGVNFWAQRQLSTPSPTWYSSYLGKGTFSWSCRAGGLGSRPCASISCLWGRRFFYRNGHLNIESKKQK